MPYTFLRELWELQTFTGGDSNQKVKLTRKWRTDALFPEREEQTRPPRASNCSSFQHARLHQWRLLRMNKSW